MRRGGATVGAARSGVSFEAVSLESLESFSSRSVSFTESSTALFTLASAAAAASLSAARRAAASCSVSRSTYLPPRRTRTGAPAAAATTMSASSTAGSDHVMGSEAASPASPAASMRRFSTASSRWNAMAMLTRCATLRTSSMSSPAHVNSSDATSIFSSVSGAGGGDFCANTAFASLAHAAAFFWRAFAEASARASADCEDFCFLPPHARSTPLTSCSSCATDLR